MDGIYDITMETPVGVEQGTVKFITEGDNLRGFLNIMGGTNDFLGGNIKGNTFEFSGEIRKILSNIKYKVTGVVEGNRLEGKAITKYGVLMISGKRQ